MVQRWQRCRYRSLHHQQVRSQDSGGLEEVRWLLAGWTERKFDIAVIQIVPDPSLRMQMVTSGKIHITRELIYDDLKKLENNPNVYIAQKPSFQVLYLFFNTKKFPFNNPDFRAAVAMRYRTRRSLITFCSATVCNLQESYPRACSVMRIIYHCSHKTWRKPNSFWPNQTSIQRT